MHERREKAVVLTEWAHRCHLKPLQFWEMRLHGVLGADGVKCMIEEERPDSRIQICLHCMEWLVRNTDGKIVLASSRLEGYYGIINANLED